MSNSKNKQTRYLHHIQSCNDFDPNQYLPFYVSNNPLGAISLNFVDHLRRWNDVFQECDNKITLNESLKTSEQRTKAVKPIIEVLHKEGIIDSWVNELYAVNSQYGEEPYFLIERAAVSYFGIRGYGVHINGMVEKSDGTYLWIARRAKDKPFWPGQLDQMVAGGQPAGIGRMENIIKESAEEANIPESIARTAKLVSTLHYRGAAKRGMSVDTLFNYDLYLPEDFVPENTDGEVDEFILMSLEEVAHITNTTDDFKDNCNLVNIDLLLRRDLIDESHPDYSEIKKVLYAPAGHFNE